MNITIDITDKLRQRLCRFLMGTALLLLTGCGPEVWKWQEEAKLDDGKKIIVDREVIFGGARLPWEKSRLQSEYILRFASPTDPKTKYEYRSIGGLAPAAIAFVGGVPFVVGSVRNGEADMYYGCPDPELIVHRYNNGKWKRDNLKALPSALTEMNLALFSNPAMDNAKAGGRATAEQINAWNKQTANRASGKYAGTPIYVLTRPKPGSLEYDCPAVGGSEMSAEWKADYRKRYVPSITE
jgi:hypothetical protein